ncbi:hypothetical protein T10_1810 [Trichinella papuae]|uniref:Uncharacterized protein n=1 Tax=Trichinella papuae TaxID=268474 RepID=A0A0V1ME32_9BILA|nr:hypothetical protein T10_1810 [Trichinella papuae]
MIGFLASHCSMVPSDPAGVACQGIGQSYLFRLSSSSSADSGIEQASSVNRTVTLPSAAPLRFALIISSGQLASQFG